MTNIRMKDQGCMLRAYKRNIVDAIVRTNERSMFIPALAYTFASNPDEIEVEHAARNSGESKYSLYKLIRLNFDLITGFTLVPLQLFTIFGFLSSIGSLALVAILMFRRIFGGSEAEGVFTLFAILFFLISVSMIGIGLIGGVAVTGGVQGQNLPDTHPVFGQKVDPLICRPAQLPHPSAGWERGYRQQNSCFFHSIVLTDARCPGCTRRWCGRRRRSPPWRCSPGSCGSRPAHPRNPPASLPSSECIPSRPAES